MLEISLYTESRKSSYNLSHGSIGNKFMENKKKIIRNIAICMLLLIVASLYIAIKKNKDAEWFDEKELYDPFIVTVDANSPQSRFTVPAGCVTTATNNYMTYNVLDEELDRKSTRLNSSHRT